MVYTLPEGPALQQVPPFPLLTLAQTPRDRRENTLWEGMLKKNSALIPLTLDYNGSSCQELPNRSLSSSPEPEELDPTAAVASSKPSPGKLARRGSKGQRLYSE